MFALPAVLQWRQKGCVKMDKFLMDTSGLQKRLASVNEYGARVCADIRDMQARDAEVFGSLIESERRSNANLDELADNSEYLKELSELRRIADAAEARAKLAEQKAENAEKYSKFSDRIAILSLVVSVVSAAAAVASAVIAYMALTPVG